MASNSLRRPSVSSPILILSSNSFRPSGSNDSMTQSTSRMKTAENAAITYWPTPQASPTASVEQHDAGVLRVLDLRAVAHQAGRADDAEGARQVAADDQHHDGGHDREDDLGLDDRDLARRRAAALRPQGQHRAERRRQRQPQQRVADLVEGVRRRAAARSAPAPRPATAGRCIADRTQRGRAQRDQGQRRAAAPVEIVAFIVRVPALRRSSV